MHFAEFCDFFIYYCKCLYLFVSSWFHFSIFFWIFVLQDVYLRWLQHFSCLLFYDYVFIFLYIFKACFCFCLCETLFFVVFSFRFIFHNSSKNVFSLLLLFLSGKNLVLFFTRESSVSFLFLNFSISLNFLSNTLRSVFSYPMLLFGVGQKLRPSLSRIIGLYLTCV